MAAEAQLDPDSLFLPVLPSPEWFSLLEAEQEMSSGLLVPVTCTQLCPSLCPQQPQSLDVQLSLHQGSQAGSTPGLGFLPTLSPPHPKWAGKGALQQEPRARRGQLWCCLEMSSSALFQPHSSLIPSLRACTEPPSWDQAGAEELQHPLGALVSLLGAGPGWLWCPISSWLLPWL